MRGLIIAASIALLLASIPAGRGVGSPAGRDGSRHPAPEGAAPRLTPETASSFARLALDCVRREYPNKADHVMNDARDVREPSAMHPAFYGCFDWHSAVHGHWMLVRILRLYPDLAEAGDVRSALDENLTRERIAREVAYLEEPNRKSFERTYGWAWLLKLAEELHRWDDPGARRWGDALAPLAKAVAARYVDFLPRQTYAIRTGVHPNTAFGMAFALDYADAVGDSVLRSTLVERSLAYYSGDADCPAAWEPGGEDFFSPCLMEADLMRRVLEPEDFRAWFRNFLPALHDGRAQNFFQPATVADRTDPKIVHLDGLNLSRAWCMAGIASALAPDDPVRARLSASAVSHARDALAHVASGHYEGEHWLASFAVYTLFALEEGS
jgi:hypothetical protein